MSDKIIKLPYWTIPIIEFLKKHGIIKEGTERVYQCKMCDMHVAEYAIERHLRFNHPEVLDESS